MKKTILLILAVVTILSFAGCSKKNKDDSAAGTTTTTSAAGNSGSEEILDGDMIIDDLLGSDSDSGYIDGEQNDEITDTMDEDDIPDATAGRTKPSSGARKTNAYAKGELNRLASLVCKSDSDVVKALGKGRSENVYGKDKASISARKYRYSINGTKEDVFVYYDSNGIVDRIVVSPETSGITLYSAILTREFGKPDKISENGLSYEYLSIWKTKDAEVTLTKRNGRVSIIFR